MYERNREMERPNILGVIFEPLRMPWLYQVLLWLLKLSIRVPLRLLRGKEKRDEILKCDRFYVHLTGVETRYK